MYNRNHIWILQNYTSHVVNALLRQFWVTCLICVMNPELTYDSTIGTLQHHMHLDAHKPAKPDSMDVYMHMLCAHRHLWGVNKDIWKPTKTWSQMQARVDIYNIKKNLLSLIDYICRIFDNIQKNAVHKKVEAKIDPNLSDWQCKINS